MIKMCRFWDQSKMLWARYFLSLEKNGAQNTIKTLTEIQTIGLENLFIQRMKFKIYKEVFSKKLKKNWHDKWSMWI